jgi:hypothetical protein
VDGVSAGAVTTYSFTNVTANHTIQARFTFVSYAITASAGSSGSIAPSGVVLVNKGGSQTFNFTPVVGYQIGDVLVDGVSVGAVYTYNFDNIAASHTIHVQFTNVSNFHQITASTRPVGAAKISSAVAESQGTISNSGVNKVNDGNSMDFIITPAAGYQVVDVLVDRVSVGAVTKYSFTNITSNHAIQAMFAPVTINDLTVKRSSENFVVLQWTPPSKQTVQTYILEMGILNNMNDKSLTSEVTIDPAQLSLTNYATLKHEVPYPGCKYSLALRYFTSTGEYSALSNRVEVTTLAKFIDDDLDGSDPFITRDADSLFIASNALKLGFQWSSWKKLGANSYIVEVKNPDSKQLLFTKTIPDTVLVIEGEPKKRYVVEISPQNASGVTLGKFNTRPIMCISGSQLPPGKPEIKPVIK